MVRITDQERVDFETLVIPTVASSIVYLYTKYIQRIKEQAQDTLPSSPPSFEGFMNYLTTLYEIKPTA